MTSKSIIVYLNKGDKLNNNYYSTLNRKIWYVLKEQDALENINYMMCHHEEDNTAQHRKDLNAYKAWIKKDSTLHGTIISYNGDDLIHEYK